MARVAAAGGSSAAGIARGGNSGDGPATLAVTFADMHKASTPHPTIFFIQRSVRGRMELFQDSTYSPHQRNPDRLHYRRLPQRLLLYG
jgi:hypothetical protein